MSPAQRNHLHARPLSARQRQPLSWGQALQILPARCCRMMALPAKAQLLPRLQRMLPRLYAPPPPAPPRSSAALHPAHLHLGGGLDLQGAGAGAGTDLAAGGAAQAGSGLAKLVHRGGRGPGACREAGGGLSNRDHGIRGVGPAPRRQGGLLGCALLTGQQAAITPPLRRCIGRDRGVPSCPSMSGGLPGGPGGLVQRASTLPSSRQPPAGPILPAPHNHLRGDADGEGAGLQAALGTAAELSELIALFTRRRLVAWRTGWWHRGVIQGKWRPAVTPRPYLH